MSTQNFHDSWPDSCDRHPSVVDVLAPVAVDQTYSYRAPAHLRVEVGDIVEMPLGRAQSFGVVVEKRRGEGANLKEITAKRDLPPIPASLIKFVDRVARWVIAPRGMVLRLALRAIDDIGPPAPRLVFQTTGKTPERLTPARARALAAAADGSALAKSALAVKANVSAGVIDALVDCGALEPILLPAPAIAPRPDPDHASQVLEPAQITCSRAIIERVRQQCFAPILLEGVTGSGKTDVYFEAIAETLRAGGQALVLMPEIALTGQFLDRFEKRFGVFPGQWHSGVAPRKRGALWEAVAQNEAKVVAGARSALFLPFKDLRLIIVDEEHESAYKQDDGVIYHARDMAVWRAQIENACVVLASATPSVETRFNAQTGRYQWLRLPDRALGRAQPKITALDLRRDPPPRGRWISRPLQQELAKNLESGEQSLLFLNRRGYAPLTLCRSCGHRFQCPHCTSWLVEHRFRRALMCHQCGFVERTPQTCPECGETNSLVPCGPGVERLAEEAAALFPQARLMTLSSDFPGGVELMRNQLADVAAGCVDIVIGTQLVAKGHHFPLMTLVGVVDADIGLGGADPRAAERTFQLMQQAVGRAGRGERAGRGLLQSWRPDQPVIAALIANDQERFYEEEIRNRKIGCMPPFSRLAGLVVSAKERAAAENFARALARAGAGLSDLFPLAPPGSLAGREEIALMGPAEAPIAMTRGRHRFRLLVRAPKNIDLQNFVRTLLRCAPKPTGSVRVVVDIEPLSFL